ncbi:cyclase family protein [Haploplasma axanthum]|uniref:Kynurenine formamidase n=1 Tax=Haploplasma axanthum TaxID=29552 RepID=A0A449BFU3_HAPAX|nr:cyclase family protein [Haploplasma axanthum]VEU81324.1 Kynurenine formamidase [Haploplasma axanthum]
MKKVIDLTYLINEEISIYPGDSKFEIKQQKNLETDGYVINEIKTNMHIGTHIDVPKHLIKSDLSVSDYSLTNFFGEAIVIDSEGRDIIEWSLEYENLIRENCILIIYTGFNIKQENYYLKHPNITENMARKLASKKIKMLVLDTPSPDYEPFNVHKILFNEGIFIVENATNLKELLNYQKIEFFAIPLKIETEASLVRAFALVE